MARKRLSDLLREEVKKPTDGGASEEKLQEVDSPTEDATAIDPNGQSTELKAAQQREAELNQKIADLTQQLADLKAELKTQTAATKKLQTNLEKAEQHSQQLEADLTEAKQTALQLADSNAELKQQLETLKQSQLAKPPAPVAKTVSTPAPKPDNKLASKPLSQQEVLRRQANSLAHPMFPAGKAPGQFSEQDLGWFD